MKINKSSQQEIDAGYSRQETEFDIADNYIDWLQEHADELDEAYDSNSTEETDGSTETGETASIDWYDDAYFERDGLILTPDYAKGTMAFVLEYPAIGLRRGVYTGSTYADITYDFDLWMTVLYNPYQRLGKTNLFIMGHNSLQQDLSFNNVRYSKIGDNFYLYSVSGIYEYTITNIFCEWRETVSKQYMGRTDLDPDICYIATCGRDDMYLPDGSSTRYRDFILEGHLVKRYPLSEYGELLIEQENSWRQNIEE